MLSGWGQWKKEENKAKGKEKRLCQAVYKQEQRITGSWTFKEGAILKRRVHFNLGRGSPLSIRTENSDCLDKVYLGPCEPPGADWSLQA